MLRITLTTLLAAALLPACAGPAAEPARAAAPAAVSVAMALPLGTRQCESGGPTAESLAAALRNAGVGVTAVGCGHDGRMRPAVCGAGDGRLAVVDVPAAQQPQAEALGWKPLSAMPDARRQPC